MPDSTPYHHGNLRAALIEASVALARRDGPDGIALRQVAREVGVSHNAAYRHFSDRDELVAEVGAYGLAGLCAAMQRRLDEAADIGPGADPVRLARRRLSALGRGYVDFAIAEPGVFKLVFSAYAHLSAKHTAELPDPLGMLGAALDELVAVGRLDPRRRPGAEVMCWSAVHGFATLHVDGPLREVPEAERDAALEHVLDTIDRGYGGADD